MASASVPRILIADDQPDIGEALRLLFKAEGWKSEVVASPRAALDAIGRTEFDLLFADLNYTRDTTSGQEGLDLLARVPVLDPTLPVVVMTAGASVEGAVEAMRRGAARSGSARRRARARCPTASARSRAPRGASPRRPPRRWPKRS